MADPKHYQTLENAVRERGSLLFNDTETYRTGNELPRWYTEVRLTPSSSWLREDEVKAMSLSDIAKWVGARFPASVILKDYVKSRKQDWFDACFIRDAKDEEDVVRVVTNFLRLTDDVRQGGLVFREYVPLLQVGVHPKSHMPMVNEHRTFFFRGKPIYATRYWESADYGELKGPDPDWLQTVAGSVSSDFYTADSAQKDDHTWVLIEIGDGGPSGLPDATDALTFYRNLQAANTTESV